MYDWILFFDCDEYLILRKHNSIQDYLSTFPDSCDCVHINWMCMSDNDMIDNDGRPLNERFTKRADKFVVVRNNIPENAHIKSIIKPHSNIEFTNPHFALGCVQCRLNNGDLHNNSAFNMHINWDNAYIKHFSFKTITEYLYNKILKGAADQPAEEYFQKIKIDDFFIINNKTKEKEQIIFDFLKKYPQYSFLYKTASNKKNINIDLYTLCWNEMEITPLVVDYWKNLNLRHITIYDSNSNDGCIEYIKSHLDNVTVINTNQNDFNDLKNIDIKNNCWKNSDADFVIVCDFDECLYHEHLYNILSYMKTNKMTYTYTWFLETISAEKQYNPDKLYHEYENVKVIPQSKKDKCLIFSPKDIKEINYGVGAHECHPAGGNVKLYDKFETDPIKTIHIKNLSLDYTLNRYHILSRRLSQINKKHGYGGHYNFPDKRIIGEFNYKLNICKKYNDVNVCSLNNLIRNSLSKQTEFIII